MPAASSAERALAVPAAARVAMVVIGWIPFAHLLLVAGPLGLAIARRDGRLAVLAVAVLYLLPPLAVRALLAARAMPIGRVELASGDYLRWWTTAQWQVIFARLPWLEELLRLVPGLYSAWLRLWGARVGSLVYWSPGVAILDRPLVHIGDRVAFGMGVRLNPHVIAPLRSGRGALFVAPISIGHDVLVGGYSLLMAGCQVADGEMTPPLRTIHPYSRLEAGRRTRRADIPDLDDVDVP